MSKALRFIVVLVLAAQFAAVAAAQTRPKVTALGIEHPESLLFVGNSFFYFNNGIDGLVRGLHYAADPTRPLHSTLITIGGASWKWHDVGSYFRPNAVNAFFFDRQNNVVFNKTDKLFDVAVMMDCSQCTIHPALKEDFFVYARKHSDAVRRHGATPVFFMTWAYADRPEMAAQIAEAYTQAGNENGVLVVPAGLAFARVAKERPDIDLYFYDKRHPTLAGSYLAACTIFASLFNRSPAGLNYTAGLPRSTATRLQEAAWATVLEYYSR